MIPEPSNDPAEPMDALIEFPEGLLGFPETTRYVLTNGPANGLYWLVAAEETGPNFLLSDPFVFFDEYSLVLTDAQSQRVGATSSSDVAVMAITVPGGEGEPWTANLRGPVVINVRNALGAQLVLTDEAAGLRSPFEPGLSPVAA